MTPVSMRQVDKLLDLRRGTANYLRQQGLFLAVQAGKAFVVDESELPIISDVIRAHMGPPDEEPCITPEEAAARIGVTRTTIYNQVRNQRIKGYKRGKFLYVTVKSVEEYRLNRLPPGVALRVRRSG